MTELTNYTLNEFLQQDEELIKEYSKILRLVEPIPTTNELKNLKLSEVEYVKQNIDNMGAITTIFQYLEGVDEKQLMKMKIVNFYGLFNSIMKQLEQILALEEEHLVSEHTDFKWEAVEGSKRLGVLGILPMVDNLAGGDILKYDAILEQPYMTVFRKLMLDRIKSDIQKDMEKIKTKTDV